MSVTLDERQLPDRIFTRRPRAVVSCRHSSWSRFDPAWPSYNPFGPFLPFVPLFIQPTPVHTFALCDSRCPLSRLGHSPFALHHADQERQCDLPPVSRDKRPTVCARSYPCLLGRWPCLRFSCCFPGLGVFRGARTYQLGSASPSVESNGHRVSVGL